MSSDTKICPYCFEEIKSEAVKCRWCRSNLNPLFSQTDWHRNLSGRRFLGVASALSEHTTLSVFAWRVIFVVTSLIHGIGFLVYLGIWTMTPYNKAGKSPLERVLQAFKQSYDTIRRDEVHNSVAANSD